jgi:hypothetical protein
MRVSKVGGGWQESLDDHMTMTLGNYNQQEHAADDEGSDKEGKGSKDNGDGNEGGGLQRGHGQQGQ